MLGFAAPAVGARILRANERLNIGVIGVGGRGAGDLAGVAGENIVALCDVDWGFAARGYDSIPQQVAAME